MERLWAPWRMAYVTNETKEKTSGCVFCDLLASRTNDRSHLVLHREPNSFVVMNKYPYNNGHLLVLPNIHVSHFNQLDADTFLEVHQLLHRAVKNVEQAMQPQGVNVGMNLGATAGAGIPAHMHYHIVPRWDGDTNFMPVIGQTKVISQHILESYDQLKPFFSK